jgi:hypothetical protein
MTGAKKGHVVLGGRADVVHLGDIEDDKQEPLTRLTVFFFASKVRVLEKMTTWNLACDAASAGTKPSGSSARGDQVC